MANKITVTRKADIKKLTIGIDAPADTNAETLRGLAETGNNEAIFEDLFSEDVVEGIRLNAPIRTVADLTRHIEKLETQLAAATAAGELPSDKAKEAAIALGAAKAEAKKPKPVSERLLGGLKRVSEIFGEAKKIGENAEKVFKFVNKAAPYANLLLAGAKALLGPTAAP